jgi:hypothetical protein
MRAPFANRRLLRGIRGMSLAGMRSFLQMQRDGQSRQAGLERGAQITGAPSAYAPRVTSDQRGSCARTKQAVSQHSGKQARERKGLKHTSGTIFSYGAGSSDRNNRNHPHRKPATVARAVGPFRIATKVRNSVNSIKNWQKLFNGKPPEFVVRCVYVARCRVTETLPQVRKSKFCLCDTRAPQQAWSCRSRP